MNFGFCCVRICQLNKSMETSCLVTTVQAAGGGVMVWGMWKLWIITLFLFIQMERNMVLSTEGCAKVSELVQSLLLRVSTKWPGVTLGLYGRRTLIDQIRHKDVLYGRMTSNQILFEVYQKSCFHPKHWSSSWGNLPFSDMLWWR